MQTLQDLITKVRRWLEEPTPGKWTDPEIADALSDRQRAIARKLFEADESFFQYRLDLSLVAGTTYYDLPTSLLHIVTVLSSANGTYVPTKWVTPRDLWKAECQGGLVGLYLSGKQIAAVKETSATGTLRVIYNRLLPDLQYGTAQTNTVKTQIILASSPTAGLIAKEDDELNGAWVYIVSGAAAGETGQITDYVGASKVATVSAAFSSAPTSNSVYSLLSEIPKEWEPLLDLGTAVRLLAKSGEGAVRDLMIQEYNYIFGGLEESLLQRQTQENRAVDVTAEDLGGLD